MQAYYGCWELVSASATSPSLLQGSQLCSDATRMGGLVGLWGSDEGCGVPCSQQHYSLVIRRLRIRSS